MKAFRVFMAAGCGKTAPMLLALMWPISASATVTQQIHAVFNPDSANPQFNQFKNLTPNSGFCLDNPPQCKQANLFSLRLPIPSNSIATIRGEHADPRQGAMFRIPSDWQDIEVSQPGSPPQVVKFRVAGMGVAYKLPRPAPELTGGLGHSFLFEKGTWMTAGAPCTGLAGAGNDIGYNSFWRHPVGAGTCAKKAMFDIPPPFRYETFDITYELITPNPLQMTAGEYTGQHVFRVGPHQDFDLGDVMDAEDKEIVLDFLLKVEHVLKVDVPPGGNRVELEPQGGWQSWLQNGRKPTRLFRDQTFNVSASTRFKMKLDCSVYIGDGCGLYDPVNGAVPLDVSVSLPHGLTDADGKIVNRQLLKTNQEPLFQPGFYVDRKPGTLHFDVRADYVAFIIRPGQSRKYSGRVTVIWDSDV